MIKPQVTALKKVSRFTLMSNEVFLILVLLLSVLFAPFWGVMGLKIELFKLVTFIIFLTNTPRALLWALILSPLLDQQQFLPPGFNGLELFLGWALLWVTSYFFEERTFWVHWGTFSVFIALCNLGRYNYYQYLDFVLIPSKFMFETILHILLYPLAILLLSQFLRKYLGRSHV